MSDIRLGQYFSKELSFLLISINMKNLVCKFASGLRVICLSLCLFCMCLAGYGSSAYPDLVDFKQPDGTIVKVRMRGSEFLKWAETEDGYTLMYDSKGFLVFAQQNAQGNMAPSLLKAENAGRRSTTTLQFLSRTSKNLKFSKSQVEVFRQVNIKRMQYNAPQTRTAKTKVEPIVGTRHFLLILMDFPDCPFTLQKSEFEELMNQLNYTGGGNHGSVRDFYRENSFGKLDLVTDVVGIYRAAHPKAYYGGNDENGNDSHPQELAREAITLASKEVDYAKYDNDNDGSVDGVHIIFAGHGEEAGGGADCIWSHKWSTYAYFNGKNVSNYSCSPELQGASGNVRTYIGVICHELGHVLGCMDFYDTDYMYDGQYDGTGKWDVMATGSWNRGGACPPHFNPYVKIYDFGWADVTEISEPLSITLHSQTASDFIRINTQTKGEYFLLEYRTEQGFDASIPGSGLMIYRATDDLNKRWSNTINSTHKQQFYPVCAGSGVAIPNFNSNSYGITNSAMTPFPGIKNVTEFTDYSIPSMQSWNGLETHYPITAISEDILQKKISFDIAGGSTGAAYGLHVSDSGLDFISLEWNNPQNRKVMLVGSSEFKFGNLQNKIYTPGEQIDGGGTVLYVGMDCRFYHTQLEEHQTFYYKLYTLSEDEMEWSAGIEARGMTKLGVIRRFPFVEDFEIEDIDNWANECIYGNIKWKRVTETDVLYGLGEITPCFLFSSYGSVGSHFSTRLVSPVIDFSNRKCAYLAFDYHNIDHIFEIYYRRTENDSWHLLSEIPFDKDEGFILKPWHTIDMELPELSNEYQIAFFTDRNIGTASITSSSQAVAIDNIRIETDFPVLIKTLPYKTLGATTADVPIQLIKGVEPIIESGISWSVDQNKWNNVKNETDDNIVKLTELSRGNIFYYRGYVVTSNGTYYGDVLSASTLGLEKGEGSEDTPFLIENAEDWLSFCAIVNGGNECKGQYFLITESFTLPNNYRCDGVFNGNIIGQDCVFKISSDISCLFSTLGEEGSMRNLTIEYTGTKNTVLATSSGCLVIKNAGSILNCTVDIFPVINSSSDFGGICRENYGFIGLCRSRLCISQSGGGYLGGICVRNFNTIEQCVFDGKIIGSGSRWITGGGICAINDTMTENGITTYGVVKNCVNNGAISADCASLGGITGSNYGIIEKCINTGNLECQIVASMGGIASSNNNAGNNGGILNCYSIGNIINNGSRTDTWLGGIVGEHRYSFIRNCFSTGTITSDNSASFHAIVGFIENGVSQDCYYVDGEDEYGEKITEERLKSSDFVNLLNQNVNEEIWSEGLEGHPVLLLEVNPLTMNTLSSNKFTKNSVVVRGNALGENIIKCGIEWKPVASSYWQRVSGNQGTEMTFELSGLIPASLYEYRVYVITDDGEQHYAETKQVSTLFATKGNNNEPHQIKDASELRAFAQMVEQGENFGNQIVVLMNDIDLQGKLWTPIRNIFQGEFDGNRKQIYNLRILSNNSCVGFFSGLHLYCKVHDFSIINGEIEVIYTNKDRAYTSGAGGIAGEANGNETEHPLIYNCSYSGVIKGGHTIGGIVGSSQYGVVENCYARAILETDFNGEVAIGGISGLGDVINSYFVGTISAPYATMKYIGGIIGDEKCHYYEGGKWAATHSYYSSDITDVTNSQGMAISENEMRQGNFVQELNGQAQHYITWITDNQERPINGGLPLFDWFGQTKVTTLPIDNENMQVVLRGLCTSSTSEIPSGVGFEWYALQDTISHRITFGYNEIFITKLSILKSNKSYFYRSFVTLLDGTEKYGEWIEFMQPIQIPILTVHNTVVDKREATLSGELMQGSEQIVQVAFEYGLMESEEKNSVILDDLDLNVKVAELLPGEWYEYRIKAFTVDGFSYYSTPIVWLQPVNKGDSNGNDEVNVTDIVSTTDYIVGKNPVPFFFMNSDVNEDNIINIMDVVGTINIIFGQYECPSSLARTMSINQGEITTGGQVVVSSPVDIQGFDIAYEGSLEVASALQGFTLIDYEKNGEKRIMGYSMNQIIPAGTSTLFYSNSKMRVYDYLFVDRTGNRIEMKYNPTGIDTIQSENKLKIYIDNNKLCVESLDRVDNITIYTLDGVKVVCDDAVKEISLMGLTKGMYILLIRTEKGLSTHKICIK